jgi:hypothetical protein
MSKSAQKSPNAKASRVPVAKAPSTSGAVANKTDPASKQTRVISMLQSADGTTIDAMMEATGWQQHSVRGFLAGVVRKKLKLKLSSTKVDGRRIYRIDQCNAVKASNKSSKRRAA